MHQINRDGNSKQQFTRDSSRAECLARANKKNEWKIHWVALLSLENYLLRKSHFNCSQQSPTNYLYASHMHNINYFHIWSTCSVYHVWPHTHTHMPIRSRKKRLMYQLFIFYIYTKPLLINKRNYILYTFIHGRIPQVYHTKNVPADAHRSVAVALG